MVALWRFHRQLHGFTTIENFTQCGVFCHTSTIVTARDEKSTCPGGAHRWCRNDGGRESGGGRTVVTAAAPTQVSPDHGRRSGAYLASSESVPRGRCATTRAAAGTALQETWALNTPLLCTASYLWNANTWFVSVWVCVHFLFILYLPWGEGNAMVGKLCELADEVTLLRSRGEVVVSLQLNQSILGRCCWVTGHLHVNSGIDSYISKRIT